jgi:REP element-mobilizing transposase RayT
MTNDPLIPQRKSIRLPGYDYTLAGAYFITLVTWQRECLFGEVIMDSQEGCAPGIRLNPYGEILSRVWQETALIRPNVILDEFVIMPNHVHGILIIQETIGKGDPGSLRECYARQRSNRARQHLSNRTRQRLSNRARQHLSNRAKQRSNRARQRSNRARQRSNRATHRVALTQIGGGVDWSDYRTNQIPDHQTNQPNSPYPGRTGLAAKLL